MQRLLATVILLLAAGVAFNASAAQEITHQQAQDMHLKLIGTVDTASTDDPMDAAERLAKKADAKGGRYYVIIAEDQRNRTVAVAEVYQ